MNDHQPYDQLLRDKLSRLPVPDVQKTWPDMRILLDEEMPEGGGSRRRGGWWFFSAVLIFIMAGSWTLLTLNFSKQNGDPPLSGAKTTSPPAATVSETEKDKSGTQIDSEKPGVEDDKILLSKEQRPDNKQSGSENKEVSGENIENTVQSLAIKTVRDGDQAQSVSGGKDHDLINPETGDKLTRNKPAGDKVTVDRSIGNNSIGDKVIADNAIGERTNADKSVADKSVADKSVGNKSVGNNSVGNNSVGNKSVGNKSTLDKSTGDKSTGDRAVSGSSTLNRPASGEKVSRNNNSVPDSKQPLSASIAAVGVSDKSQDDLNDATTIKNIERLPSASFAEKIDSINKDYGSYITYAPVSRKYYRQNKKYGRPANVRPPYTTEGRSFAIGLSLPLVFPLGDQQALSYNVNAGPNTSTDYIPAPHAQYHFNGKVYMQSELQVLSPQYIKPALLYQTQTSNNFYQTTSSVSAQKLYYFNVPVSLHYSPFKHFYMGTGLQFSSLLSGVAMHEEQRTGMVSSDSMYIATYSKFRNDSISDKLSGSEMRLMLDANYYWNKFTVGLRYNQALSNYVSTRAAPSVPMTVDKNKSLQFYLRYNLWEDKKRKNVNGQTLAAK